MSNTSNNGNEFVVRLQARNAEPLHFKWSSAGMLASGSAESAKVKILRRDANGLLTVLWGERVVSGIVVRGERGDSLNLNIDGQPVAVTVRGAMLDAMEQGLAAGHAGNSVLDLTSPIPGLVKGVLLKVGETAAAGQTVIVLEAMKMENEISAPAEGIIEAVEVKAGQTVAAGAVLARIKMNGAAQ
jgi:biotin carboxyl carrier protein